MNDSQKLFLAEAIDLAILKMLQRVPPLISSPKEQHKKGDQANEVTLDQWKCAFAWIPVDEVRSGSFSEASVLKLSEVARSLVAVMESGRGPIMMSGCVELHPLVPCDEHRASIQHVHVRVTTDWSLKQEQFFELQFDILYGYRDGQESRQAA
jgi:hypothetical protein